MEVGTKGFVLLYLLEVILKVFPKKFSLNVFGKKVEVKVLKGLREQGVEGLFIPAKWSILVNLEQSKEDAVKTLLHELTHAMIHRTGINQSLSHDLEEVIAENVSTVICENFNLVLKKR